MEEPLNGYYESLDRIFSEAAPVYDSKIQANFINVAIREKEIDSVIKRYRKGWKLLEVGCGTGEEASKIMRITGAPLVCIDVSSGMLRFSSDKMKRLNLSEKFTPIRVPASKVSCVRGKFGIVYSFNGALNNEPNISAFMKSLVEIVEEGGYFIVSVRNRYSLSDAVISMIRGKRRRISERIGGEVKVEVVGREVTSHYYTDSEFLRLIPSSFLLEERIGLGVFAIPSIYEKIRWVGVRNTILTFENALSWVPPFNYLGDETLFVFRKR